MMTIMHSNLRLAISLTLAAGLVGACGGGGSSGATPRMPEEGEKQMQGEGDQEGEGGPTVMQPPPSTPTPATGSGIGFEVTTRTGEGIFQAARRASAATPAAGSVTQSSDVDGEGISVDVVSVTVSGDPASSAGLQFVGSYKGGASAAVDVVTTASTSERPTMSAADVEEIQNRPKGTELWERIRGTDWHGVEFYRSLRASDVEGLPAGDLWVDVYTDYEREGDDDYLAGGIWVFAPDGASPATGAYEFGAFVDGNSPFEQSRLAGLTGTATYEGEASAVHSVKSGASIRNYFPDAEVTLRANFGTNTALGTISGSVHDITGDGPPAGYSGTVVNLGAADIGGANSGFFTGAASIAATDSDPAFAGKWGGQFYGPGTDPSSVAGTFGGASTDGNQSFVGAFGAYLPGATYEQGPEEGPGPLEPLPAEPPAPAQPSTPTPATGSGIGFAVATGTAEGIFQALRRASDATPAAGSVTQSSDVDGEGISVDVVSVTVSGDPASAAGLQFVGSYKDGASAAVDVVTTASTSERPTMSAADVEEIQNRAKGTELWERIRGTDWHGVEFYRSLRASDVEGLPAGDLWVDVYTDYEREGDADYLAGGIWVFAPDGASPAAGAYEFGAFADGNSPFAQGRLAGLTGTATYEGEATAVYSVKSGASIRNYFPDAEVTLRANFGTNTALGTISGSVHDITGDGPPEGYSGTVVNLGAADIGGANSGFFTGATSIAATGSGPAFAGKWGGQFYGPGTTPNAVGGTFGGASTDGNHSFVGVFGAQQQ